jgi:hypothetical protein
MDLDQYKYLCRGICYVIKVHSDTYVFMVSTVDLKPENFPFEVFPLC